VVLFLSTLAPSVRAANDTLTLGPATIYTKSLPSNDNSIPIRVPVFIRDVSGTPLDSNGTQIKEIGFRITFDPAYVSGCTSNTLPACNISFSSNGNLNGEIDSARSGDSLTVHVRHSEAAVFDLNATAPGNLIGYLSVSIPSAVKDGDVIDLSFDPSASATYLSDGAATDAVVESADHGLDLIDGSVHITSTTPPSCIASTDKNTTLTGAGNATGCDPFTLCPTSELVGFRLEPVGRTFSGCEYIRWSFPDGTYATGTSVEHAFATSGMYDVVAAVETPLSIFTVKFTRTVTVGSKADYCRGACSAAVPSSATKSSTVVFLGGTSCTPATYDWDFGDGFVGSGQQALHAYSETGTFSWSVTVQSEDAVCVKTGTITVVPSRVRVVRH